MTKVNSVAMGTASKKVGEIVFSTVKGQTIARKYQAHVHNPKTEGQVNQRNRMANCIQLYQAVAAGIDVGFTNRNKLYSVYNAFISNNVSLMGTKRYETVDGIIEDATGPIVISTGNLGHPDVTYTDGVVRIDFNSYKWKIETGDQIKITGLNLSGEIAKITVYTVLESDIENGVASVPFTLDNINKQFKCGAIIYKKHVKTSSRAELIDW